MSDADKVNYQDTIYSLRKQMRSLIAHQDSQLSISGRHKYTINNIIGAYGLKNNRSYANTKIMRTFVGEELYKGEVLPIYQAQREYKNAKKSARAGMDTVGSPMDYMDLPTMYYFYKFRSEIVKAYEEKLAKGGKLGTFDALIEGVYNDKFSEPTKENMFFTKRSVRLSKDEVKGFVNIGVLQSRRIREAEKTAKNASNAKDILDVANLPVTEDIKADVMNYMISYVEKTKDINETEFGNMTPATWYTLKSIKTIASRKYNNAESKYMLQQYNFCDMPEDKLMAYHSKAIEMQLDQVSKGVGTVPSTKKADFEQLTIDT